MVEQTEIEKAIVDTIQIDDEGLKDVKILDIASLLKFGILDVPKFLEGMLDGENSKEFNDSSDDYVKGYKYATTGKF